MENHNSYRGLAWIGAIVFFMQALDATILNTALPSIATSFNESPLDVQMSIISYAVAISFFIPLSGWLSDRYGSLNVLRLSIVGFVLGSILCAMSTTLNQLIFARVLQGAGGALMLPVVRLVTINIVPKHQLLDVWNIITMSGLLGPILGPILGGLFVTYLTWHWIFIINIPIGIFCIMLCGRYVPNLKKSVEKLDWKGFVLFSSGLVFLTVGLDFIAEPRFSMQSAFIVLFLGGLLLFLYYLHAKSFTHCIISLELFRIRTFSILLFAILFFRLYITSVPFLLSLLFLVVLHYGADVVGYLLAPIPMCAVLIKFFITYILKRISYKTVLISTSIFTMILVAAMGLFDSNTSIFTIVILCGFYGACMSILFTSSNALAIIDISENLAGSASTMLSVIQQIGIGVGIAVASVVLKFYRDNIGDSAEKLQYSFGYTFFTISVLGVMLIWLLSYLHKDDGKSLQ
ncbi:MFS transporter [Campylobacter pinnipediorum]|uniref:MFS transporter n=1 Tax=Campylobacter pinnipediorum TaxID=1965231 RepID=UPI0018E9E41D|nr:MFS transporter [Campylobacter pinnipediorum]